MHFRLITGSLLIVGMGLGMASCTISGGEAGKAQLSDINATPEQTQSVPLSSTQRAQQKQGIKIAMLLPLSAKGGRARMAKALKQAGELALFEFNKDNIVLLARDTKGTPEGAQQAAKEAIQSGAEIIVGPLLSTSVKAVKPLATQAGLPVIAFSSDTRVAGNGVYLQSFLPGHDIDRIVSYTIAQGKRRFAAMIPDTPAGSLIETRFREAVQRHSGEIVRLEKAKPNPNDMLAPMERIGEVAGSKDENVPVVDALFMPFGAKSLPSVSPLVSYVEIDPAKVKVIGNGQWDYSSVGKEKALVGGWYPASNPAKRLAFSQKFSATYGTQPPRISSLAFDAVSLVIALSGGEKGQRFTHQNLTRSSGFAGVDGLFRFQSNGQMDRGLAIMEVQKFSSKIVDAAPTNFSRFPGQPAFANKPVTESTLASRMGLEDF